MKKLLILLVALSLVACGDKKSKEETTTETAPVVLEETVKEEASEMKENVMEEASEMKENVMEEASEMKENVMEEASEKDMKEVVEATAMEGTSSTYIVKEGDNLFRIGLKYNMLWTKLAEENNIENPDYIYVGQEIKIPKK